MMYSALCLLVTLTLAHCSVLTQEEDTESCWPNLSAAEFRQVYCTSDIVFRGNPSYVSSGLAVNENGDPVTFLYATFTSEQVYRGSPANAQAISAGREWNSESGCDAAAFPSSSQGSLLVFGTGTPTYYNIGTCQRVFSWSCLPQEIRDSLPLDCSNFNTAVA